MPKAEGENLWTTPDGKIEITHHSLWQIVLEDGSTITLGENFQDEDFGINLRDIPSIISCIKPLRSCNIF